MSQTYLSTKNELSWHQLVCRGTSGILCLPIWKDIKYNIWVQMEYMSNNICLKLTSQQRTNYLGISWYAAGHRGSCVCQSGKILNIINGFK